MAGAIIFVMFPADLVKQAQPFSIDFGGSVIKIAYKLEDEKMNGPDDLLVPVHLRSFPRAQLAQALAFVRSTVPLSATRGTPTITMTGVGTSEHASTVEKELGVRVKTVWEGLCISRMFKHLVATTDTKELFYPPVTDQVDDTDTLVEQVRALSVTFNTGNRAEMKPWDYTGHRTWPCLIVTLGSGFTFNTMWEDGKELPNVYNPCGGRSFYGLGCLLTGAKSFEELIALAEAGDDHTVNTYLKDLHLGGPESKTDKAEPADDFYSTMKQDVNVFSYGWAINKNLADFKREDLARALLYNVCHNIVQYTELIAAQQQTSNIILTGGFAMHPFIRKRLEFEFMKDKALGALFPFYTVLADTTLRTLKMGSHLGALGAMFFDVKLEKPLSV